MHYSLQFLSKAALSLGDSGDWLYCVRVQNGLSVWSGLLAAAMVLLVLCIAGVRVTGE